jgi:PqqD family protein of HPr-rel-A system
MTGQTTTSASGPSGPLLLWRGPASDTLIFRDFGAVSVVFHKPSGETHVLDPLAREALDLLTAAPHTVMSLAAALAQVTERAEAEFYEAADTILTTFDRKGLVFPLASPA